MKEFEGIIPYLVSPIKENGDVNTEELERLSNDLVEKGVSGLCALGSCGEYPYLTREQKQSVVKTVVRVSKKHNIPAIAGVCGYSERQAIEEAQSFRQLGVDGIVLMIQTYFPLDDDMIAHFIRSVAESVPDIQVILYSNPKYMHFNFNIPIFRKIVDLKNVNYFKDASGNTGFLMTLTNVFKDRFKIFSASAHIPLFVFELGGKGWMAGPACVIPEESVELYTLYKNGKREEAMSLQRKLWEINRMFAKYNLTPCIKAMLRLQGYDVGYPIPPLKDVDTEALEAMKRVLDELKRE